VRRTHNGAGSSVAFECKAAWLDSEAEAVLENWTAKQRIGSLRAGATFRAMRIDAAGLYAQRADVCEGPREQCQMILYSERLRGDFLLSRSNSRLAEVGTVTAPSRTIWRAVRLFP